METLEKKALKGGEFLIKESDHNSIFTPEQWTEEQLMIAQTCKDFISQEIFPILDRIDSMEAGLVPSLLDKAGELGLLGISIPEEFGGLGASFNTGLLVSEATGSGHSFSVSISAHTGIGTLPIMYYGNDAQKAKYLPKLATGEFKAAYCLTEPSSGSDANSGKTTATLSADGENWVLNGQKMWITNAGFADVFIVFAKIKEGDKVDDNLSAFIVEKDFAGLSLNEEEKKMGIKGSSTRQVFFNDCIVPLENQLSERGNGFKIALNILNIGRIKLAAAVVGASKEIINKSIKYANEREQFGRSISKYGAIKHKIAEQIIRTFASETATYRAGQMIDDAYDALVAGGMESNKAKLKSVEQFAVECAMLKVFGSESLDFVADEGVQIYGGMGFSAEAPMDRSYRDSRINRIFEGTNEINRMLTVDMMLRMAMKGELDLMGPAMSVGNELMSIPDFSSEEDNSPLANERKYIKNFKKACLMVAGSAVQKLMATMKKEQEVLMNLADMLIQTYVAESVLLRVEKIIATKSAEEASLYVDIAKTFFTSAADTIWLAGKEAVNSYADGDELRLMTMGLKRFTKVEPYNNKESRRRIADVYINAGTFN